MRLINVASLFGVLFLSLLLGWLDETWRMSFWVPDGVGSLNVTVLWGVAAANIVFAASLFALTWLNLRFPEPEIWVSLTYLLVGLLVVLYNTPLSSWLTLRVSIIPSNLFWDFATLKFDLAGAFALVIGLVGIVRVAQR